MDPPNRPPGPAAVSRDGSRLLLVAVVTLTVGRLAVAAQPSPSEALYHWLAAEPAAQLAEDETTIPPGFGAIFVPAMTDGNSEPQALVLRADEPVAVGRNGRRIVLHPGAYTVLVGSGPTPQMTALSVQVAAGATTLVPVRWGGLRIEVVDESNLPHRGAYELIRVSDLQPYVVGFGADRLQGEPLLTTLIPPGLYRVVKPGSSYRVRTDFATVVVPEGGLDHFRLVMNPETGQFRGAGVVTAGDLGETIDESAWIHRYAVGLAAPFTLHRNVVGEKNETTVGAEGAFDSYLNYEREGNVFSSVLELEAGFERIKPEASPAIPWRKTRDRLRMDLLYARLLNPRFGPYVRLSLRTSLFDSNTLATEAVTVAREYSDGRRELEFVPANTTFRTGDPFSPPVIREGVGVNARLLRGRAARLDWRLGICLRQNRFGGAFFLDDDPETPEVEYVQALDFNSEGVETTLVGAFRFRVFLYTTTLDLFSDLGAGFEPTIDWRSTLSWRLTGDLSLDYRVDLLWLPQVSDQTQLSQSVLFRYSLGG
ncbi:MAG: hypothetical protein OXP70_02950 [Acidobacteriota bacterium]|nr:hypothetical protein [Acidobacteriota bacterium]